ncbi:MAG: methylenetetrahydrofolate reductase [NAD(P)H] [Planctomycetes bacterium]|nr:methylenetetrahydrofolate reductase [NAD(P)H] [Planctomycetota bacterium]
MRIGNKFGRGRPVFSFEFFPPKTDEGAHQLMRTVASLKKAMAPDFISVTYGAGGSTRERTLDVVARVQKELSLTSMAHLTCVGSTRQEIEHTVGLLRKKGIENVLGLRGDLPKAAPGTAPAPQDFAYASQLIEFVKGQFDVDVGGACYPERHPESSDKRADLEWTVHKVKKGADFLITQLFFDNRDYFQFVERARDAGIRVPIVPGIMPITNVSQIERFTKMCGASIPHGLLENLREEADDPAAVMAIGIEHAIRQCRGLLEAGAPGIHFYTLNKSHATRSVLAAIKRF